MRTDQGDQLQLDVYMSRAQGTDEGRDERGAMCQLRLQRLCFQRLKRESEVQQVTTFRILRALATGRRLGGQSVILRLSFYTQPLQVSKNQCDTNRQAVGKSSILPQNIMYYDQLNRLTHPYT